MEIGEVSRRHPRVGGGTGVVAFRPGSHRQRRDSRLRRRRRVPPRTLRLSPERERVRQRAVPHQKAPASRSTPTSTATDAARSTISMAAAASISRTPTAICSKSSPAPTGPSPKGGPTRSPGKRALPRPACGERAGVTGRSATAPHFSRARLPLIRRARCACLPTSPRERGEVMLANAGDCNQELSQ